jgi:hypothetical protein
MGSRRPGDQTRLAELKPVEETGAGTGLGAKQH